MERNSFFGVKRQRALRVFYNDYDAYNTGAPSMCWWEIA
jgi:hypothetical protein